MPNPPSAVVAAHRSRRTREGRVRVEVSVHREDAALIRRVAAALANPERRQSARLLLDRHFGEPVGTSLKPLLAAAPLDGIDLDRQSDPLGNPICDRSP